MSETTSIDARAAGLGVWAVFRRHVALTWEARRAVFLGTAWFWWKSFLLLAVAGAAYWLVQWTIGTTWALRVTGVLGSFAWAWVFALYTAGATFAGLAWAREPYLREDSFGYFGALRGSGALGPVLTWTALLFVFDEATRVLIGEDAALMVVLPQAFVCWAVVPLIAGYGIRPIRALRLSVRGFARNVGFMLGFNILILVLVALLWGAWTALCILLLLVIDRGAADKLFYADQVIRTAWPIGALYLAGCLAGAIGGCGLFAAWVREVFPKIYGLPVAASGERAA